MVLRMSEKLVGCARKVAFAALLSLAAHAQSAVPATNASRRDRVAAAAEQAQPDPRLQPVDASSGGLIDRRLQSDLLDHVGDASQPGTRPTAEDQQIPVALMRRSLAGSAPGKTADAPPQDGFTSHRIASAEDATAVSLPLDELVAPTVLPVGANHSAAGTFPVPDAMSAPRTRDKMTHRESSRAKETSRVHVAGDALTGTSPSIGDHSSGPRSIHTHGAGSPPGHSPHLHHHTTTSSFSPFTSSQ